jgi:hypothetical protein
VRMKRALVLSLALLLVAFAGMARTDIFDNVVIDGSFALSGTSTTAFTCTTFLVTASTSAIFYTPSFGVGYDVGAAMTIAVADSTGDLTITHAGSNKSVTWTAAAGFDFVGAIALDAVTVSGAVSIDDATDSTNTTSGSLHTDGGAGIAKKLYVGTDLDVDGTANLDVVDIDDAVDITGNLTVDGTTVSLDGSTSVRGISAGFTSLEAPANRFGISTTIYTNFAVADTTGNLTITHVGGSTDLVTWTAAGGFSFVGATAITGTLGCSGTLSVGLDATAGTLELYPTTTNQGTTTITMTDNTGDTVTNVNFAAQAGARTYTVPDAGASAAFLMTDTFIVILPFAGGLAGEDTDAAGTNGGGMVGSTVDVTTHDFNNSGGGADDVLCKVYDQKKPTTLSLSVLMRCSAKLYSTTLLPMPVLWRLMVRWLVSGNTAMELHRGLI